MYELCPVCKQNGVNNKIKAFQINMRECVWLCEDENCTWPFGYAEFEYFEREVGKYWSYEWQTYKPVEPNFKVTVPPELSLYTPPDTPGTDTSSRESLSAAPSSLVQSITRETSKESSEITSIFGNDIDFDFNDCIVIPELEKKEIKVESSIGDSKAKPKGTPKIMKIERTRKLIKVKKEHNSSISFQSSPANRLLPEIVKSEKSESPLKTARMNYNINITPATGKNCKNAKNFQGFRFEDISNARKKKAGTKTKTSEEEVIVILDDDDEVTKVDLTGSESSEVKKEDQADKKMDNNAVIKDEDSFREKSDFGSNAGFIKPEEETLEDMLDNFPLDQCSNLVPDDVATFIDSLFT